MELNKREFGEQLEQFARQKLANSGCQIVEVNYLCRFGEIDIIAWDQKVLAFIEVRYRKQNRYGGAIASVDFRKQQKIIRTAQHYLQHHNLTNKTIGRFDVFAVQGQLDCLQCEWIKNAFNEQ